mgnify:CR=1 FL=1
MGFRDLLGKELLFFDGATGTMLQALGLQPGELPELCEDFSYLGSYSEVI